METDVLVEPERHQRRKETERDHSEKRADLRSPSFPYLRARGEKVGISLKV